MAMIINTQALGEKRMAMIINTQALGEMLLIF